MNNIILTISRNILLGLLLINSPVSHSENNKVIERIPMNYHHALTTLDSQLQKCVAKKAGLFNGGIKIETATINNVSVMHVKEYEVGGAVYGQLGSIVVSKEKGHTLVKVTDQPDLFTNLHLTQVVTLWLKGMKSCVPPK